MEFGIISFLMNEVDKMSRAIRQARQLAGFSQKQLAKKLGLSDKTISAYEKGRAIPPATTLKRIAEVTNKPINGFYRADDTVDLDLINRKLDILIKELGDIRQAL